MKPAVDPAEKERSQALAKLKSFLERRGAPRAQMTVIVAATGSAGFLFSWALLHLGLWLMWVRYTLAVALAYGVFLLLVGAWLALQRRKLGAREQASSRGGDLSDVIDLPSGGGSIGGGGGGGGGGIRAGGGSFGGGGSSASFVEGNPQVIPLIQPSSGGSDLGGVAHASASGGSSGGSSHVGGGSHGGGGGGFSLDGDDLIAVIAVIAAIGAAIGASIYVIVSAPTLLAEVLFDGALSAGLYRRLRVLDHHQWWEDAIRHTWIPVSIVAVFFGIAGYLIQRVAPEAVSIGVLWQHVFRGGL